MRRSPPFRTLLERRLSRRGLLGLGAAASLAWAARGARAGALAAASLAPQPGALRGIAPSKADELLVADGLTYDLLARWGDALFAGAPSLDPHELLDGSLTRPEAVERQRPQFGTECDGLAFFPLRGQESDRGILCCNHEFVHATLVFAGRFHPELTRPADAARERENWIARHPQAVAWMQAAHGVSVMHVARGPRGWALEVGGPLTRRITATTPCEISGPARGARLLRTRADPRGTRVLGTLANCAAGRTPWGTYLTAEENVDDYFGGMGVWERARPDAATREAHRRFPLFLSSLYGWEHVDRRFLVPHEPREPLRFGWIVEIDPMSPTAPPVKRTALGRFSHEGASTILARDGRVAVYMGDDDAFEYVYKFVTRAAFDPQSPPANRDLLDEGVLYAARFDEDGTGEWLPLVHERRGRLDRRAGFASQADVVIKARAAADLLGATPMDRPEMVEPHPTSGCVYIACTKNADRRAESERAMWAGREIDLGVSASNPRPANRRGHVIELIEDGADAAATRFRWNVFLLGGEGEAAQLACPDNLGIDAAGRLLIGTDTDDRSRWNNGAFVVQTAGPERGRVVQIASGPVGCEVCGCEYTPDGTTLFLSIQHPGEGGTIDQPISHWPDGGELPARASLVAIRREDGQPI